jgi:hypothetical protein
MEDNRAIMDVDTTSDIVVRNNGMTLTLAAATDRGFQWLHESVGTEEREIELEASHAEGLLTLARAAGLNVISSL